jgi:hypothetical protein
MQGTSDAVASRTGMLVSEVTVFSRIIVFDCVTLTCRTVLLARLLPTRACRSARLVQLESILLPVQHRAQTVQRDPSRRSLRVNLMVAREWKFVRCARQARTTPTRRPPLSLLAQLAPRVHTAPASVPPPAQHVCRARPAPIMIELAPRQLLRARSARLARTTPTPGPHLAPLAKRVLRGRTTMMLGPKLQADARYE